MKRLLWIVAIVALLPLELLTPGCATTPLGKAVQADGVVLIGVNQGMRAWHDYVIAGRATQKQLEAVQAAYTIYYNAELLAKAKFESAINAANPAAAQKDLDAAIASATAAKASLLLLIQTYMPTPSL